MNLDHIIAYKGLDDEQDSDNGFSGNVQFVICQRDSSVADVSGSNGWESDNDANGVAVITPSGRTSPQPQTKYIWSNVTMIGPRATISNVVILYIETLHRFAAIQPYPFIILSSWAGRLDYSLMPPRVRQQILILPVHLQHLTNLLTSSSRII